MTPDVDSADEAPPPDRLVFFFSGFDPKGAGYYHRLYREGAAARAGFGDARLDVGRRFRTGELASASDLTWTPSDSSAPTRTRFHFMRWDDIVRRHWTRSPAQLARDYLRVYGIGLPGGDFTRIWRKSRAAWGMAIFPLVVMATTLTIGTAVAFGLLHGLAGLRGWLAAPLSLAAALVGWRVLVRRIDCEWLLRLYAFTQSQADGSLPALETRMDAMAAWLTDTVSARLARRDAPPLKEVLLVGYSTGSTVAASVLARALTRLEGSMASSTARPALSMLTLGHCLPIAADWAAAGRVREELRRVGDCEALTWHDWSARADWAAFWRSPPWPEGSRLSGLQRSPRFHAQLTPEAYAALKRDRRLMHLQYLRPPGRPVEPTGYDWFRLTAGPSVLAASAPPVSR